MEDQATEKDVEDWGVKPRYLVNSCLCMVMIKTVLANPKVFLGGVPEEPSFLNCSLVDFRPHPRIPGYCPLASTLQHAFVRESRLFPERMHEVADSRLLQLADR